MQSWKKFESDVAQILGGTRNVRSSYGESISDIEHDLFTVECKIRKYIPVYLEKAVVKEKARLDRKIPQFIIQGLMQAKRYNGDKIALLCFKQKRRRVIIGAMWLAEIPWSWNFEFVLWGDAAIFDIQNLKKVVNPKVKRSF